MARLPVVAICVTAFAVGTTGLSSLEFGMEMTVRAYDAVCWYENLKQFPHTNAKGYNQCSGKAKYQQNAIQTKDFFKQYPDKKEEYFGKWIDDKAMDKLPKPYQTNCKKYLSDANAEPTDDEGAALNDGEKGKPYPYRAYAYCLLHTLREQHGDKGIDAVKSERTVSRKNWMTAINDRDNEFRARHSVEPLQINGDLNEQAQAWADKLASECDSHHSKNDYEGRQWNGAGTGESLHAGGGEEQKEVSAYQASDGWYEEIGHYPYPDGYQSDDESLFKEIGHFTQTVWKGSKYVGYGYAYNADCKDKGAYTQYVVGRYSPAGNVDGQFPANVNPPKDD